MASFVERMKEKWGITSTWKFIAILLVFSLAGLAITQCRKPVFHLFHLTAETPLWIKTVVYLLAVFPLYQFFLLLFSVPLGSFKFFWEKEKKLGKWFLSRLTLKPSGEKA